jgi:predicted dienelactone hydrolase
MNVGYRALEGIDDVQRVTVPVRALYPTHAPARAQAFGPYELEVAHRAEPAGERLPVVVVSHGGGATPWPLRLLAAHLARAGWCAALVEHPGDRRGDDALANKPENLANRPRHVRRALDALHADPLLGPRLTAGATIVGHSMGGYTALAVAGGRPIALPNQTPDGVAHPVAVEPDPRVRAVALLAPAVPWFMAPGALDAVRVPLLVRTAEHDTLTPPFFIEQILAGLPAGTHVDLAVVPGAGHFSFLAPMPPAFAHAPPAQDPPGFDRVAYQPRLCAEVEAFLARYAG